jgi:aminoglycoside phosphotransferase (APT) family kinase protein
MSAENVIVAPEVRELDVLAGQLTRWLQPRMPDATDFHVQNLSYPFGAGRSHETILFDVSWSEGGKRVSKEWVVRIKPRRHTVFPDDLFEQQFRVMQVVHAHGSVRVAKTLWFESDPTLLGAPFFVMERRRGRVPVSVPPYVQTGWVAEATAAQRAKMWENGVRQLAAVQGVPLSSVQFLAGRDGARDGLAQEWDKYVRFVDWINEGERRWPVLEAGLARLKSLWPKNQPAGLVWGDARMGNMMYDENFEVVAVMDWEQPSLGGALHDLAWFLYISNMMHGATPERPHMEGMGTREQTIALWNQLTGISTADIEWYEDFTALKLSCTGIRLQSLKGVVYYDEAWLAKRLKVA